MCTEQAGLRHGLSRYIASPWCASERRTDAPSTTIVKGSHNEDDPNNCMLQHLLPLVSQVLADGDGVALPLAKLPAAERHQFTLDMCQGSQSPSSMAPDPKNTQKNPRCL